MEHSLAKELWEAGYPLRRIEPGMCVGPWPTLDLNPAGDQEIDAQHFYEPTLEELIESCGNSLQSLNQNENWDAWGVYYCCDEHGEGKKIESGSTPTEAVARLWLVLNPVDKLGIKGGTSGG